MLGQFENWLKQECSSLEVTAFPVWNTPVKFLASTVEKRLKIGVRKMALKVATIYIAWQSIVCCEEQVKRVDIGRLAVF